MGLTILHHFLCAPVCFYMLLCASVCSCVLLFALVCPCVLLHAQREEQVEDQRVLISKLEQVMHITTRLCVLVFVFVFIFVFIFAFVFV